MLLLTVCSYLFSQLSWLSLVNTLPVINLLPLCSKSTVFSLHYDSRTGHYKYFSFASRRSVKALPVQGAVEKYCRKEGIVFSEPMLPADRFFARRSWQWWRPTGAHLPVSVSGTPASNLPASGFLLLSLSELLHHPMDLSHTISNKVWCQPQARGGKRPGSAKCFPSLDALLQPQKWWLFPIPDIPVEFFLTVHN